MARSQAMFTILREAVKKRWDEVPLARRGSVCRRATAGSAATEMSLP